MGVRESLNERRWLTVAAAGVALAGLAVFACLRLFPGRSSVNPMGGDKLWYTIDDGATYFADSKARTPPFDHQGKPAVIAHVFTCSGGKTKFVAYLERYTPGGQKLRQELLGKNTSVNFELDVTEKEIKLPRTGDRGWMSKANERAVEVMNPVCNDGDPKAVIEVFP